MRLIEHNDTVTLVNGEGSPHMQLVLKSLFVGGITTAIVIGHLSAAIGGWHAGWLVLLMAPLSYGWIIREWRTAHHATLEVDLRFGRVRVERRYACKTVEDKASLSDLEDLDVATEKDDDGDATYQPVLTFKDGRRINLGPAASSRAMLDRAVAAVGRLG
ncbi:MAG: hypothetical protein SFW09_00485 [Hyphomicrobiaceae bacterium]|nr:hypothetical protein [Hyphomicrobiaceae bacterium]